METVGACLRARSAVDVTRRTAACVPVGAPQVATLRFADEYAREPLLDAIDLQPGERRGYWKHYAPQKWYEQAKIRGKLNNCCGVLLLDTGVEVSILDTTFAREIGCVIDTDVTQNCVGIRVETYYAVGRTRVKITLAGNLVYFMDLWVGDMVDQHAILGMNMVPAGVRIDTADGTACLPDEVRIQLIGRRPLYGAKMHPISVASPLRIDQGRSRDIPLRPDRAAPLLGDARESQRARAAHSAHQHRPCRSRTSRPRKSHGLPKPRHQKPPPSAEESSPKETTTPRVNGAILAESGSHATKGKLTKAHAPATTTAPSTKSTRRTRASKRTEVRLSGPCVAATPSETDTLQEER
ncbi:unnamed protein product [Phytophthora fragariaefolia]|uniref:Unnamed protein product n=1 Tax=Phytophthora fragariaefolia TaxID=1490495 RepID=A0A9W7D792_9STRA|nr:unnamed protein product [Phytophthora fragariaefolia]